MAFEQPELYRDKHGKSVQAFGPYHNNVSAGNIVDDTAVTLNIPTGTIYYELASTIACYVNANGAATVNSAVFPAGAAIYKVLPGQTQVSLKRIAAETGPVSLTPLG